MRHLEGHRQEVLRLLDRPEGNLGIELGVAAGEFSRRMVASGRFRRFYGIDMYADTHDVDQYKQALRHVGLEAPYTLLRMTFDQAYDLFEDESLDFVYVDGYAHTGEDGGATIWAWARKVRPGGVIAGDDYHDDWPLVKEAVDRFAEQTGFELHVTTLVEHGPGYAQYPSWAMVKSAAVTGNAPADLVARGRAAAARIGAKRRLGRRFADLMRGVLPADLYARLRQWNRDRLRRRKR
jgi:hypothetical protein